MEDPADGPGEGTDDTARMTRESDGLEPKHRLSTQSWSADTPHGERSYLTDAGRLLLVVVGGLFLLALAVYALFLGSSIGQF